MLNGRTNKAESEPGEQRPPGSDKRGAARGLGWLRREGALILRRGGLCPGG